MKRRIAFMDGTTQPAQIERHGECVESIPFLYLGNDLAFRFNGTVIRTEHFGITGGAPVFRQFFCGEVEHAVPPTYMKCRSVP